VSRRAAVILLTVAGALVLAGLAATLVWNEARKEVVFLCGNFTAGVTQASVEKQLATGHFLRYRREPAVLGSRIVVDSAYTLGAHRCTIELDPGGVVRRAALE
jgi:hypothetical protein